MQLGPVNTYTVLNEEYELEEQDLYSYALVTGPSRLTLFVLARDVEQFQAEYQDEALEFLANNGFTNPTNSPIEILHSDECQYPDANPDFPACEE